MQQSRSTPSGTPAQQREEHEEVALKAVADAVGRLRYGTIQLTVHDGRIVQLDVTERQRFT